MRGPLSAIRHAEEASCAAMAGSTTYQAVCRCALIGVPCFDNMLKMTTSPQAKRAETDPCQGTPARAHFQPPELRKMPTKWVTKSQEEFDATYGEQTEQPWFPQLMLIRGNHLSLEQCCGARLEASCSFHWHDLFHVLFGGNHLSNTTCLTHAFFKSGESSSNFS